MRHAAAARKELGVPTAFNVLGPLTNPAQPRFSAIGAADPRVAPLMAGVFADRGAEALVFRGDDGLDELTTSTTSRLWWVVDGHVSEHVVDPARLGLAISPREALVGGEADYNADVARRTWAGERGPVRDAVVLNAGAALALAAADGAPVADVDAAIRAGIERAEEAIDSGAAATVSYENKGGAAGTIGLTAYFALLDLGRRGLLGPLGVLDRLLEGARGLEQSRALLRRGLADLLAVGLLLGAGGVRGRDGGAAGALRQVPALGGRTARARTAGRPVAVQHDEVHRPLPRGP